MMDYFFIVSIFEFSSDAHEKKFKRVEFVFSNGLKCFVVFGAGFAFFVSFATG